MKFNWKKVVSPDPRKNVMIDFEADSRIESEGWGWQAMFQIGPDRVSSLILYQTIKAAEEWLREAIPKYGR